MTRSAQPWSWPPPPSEPCSASRLASVYAPVVLASFGSGNAKIEIRVNYPGGTAGYDAALGPDLSARKTQDAQLLANSHLTVSATARAQLLSGDVDPRLPPLLAEMTSSRCGSWTSATSHPVADPRACCGPWTWRRTSARRTSRRGPTSDGCRSWSTPSGPNTDQRRASWSRCLLARPCCGSSMTRPARSVANDALARTAGVPGSLLGWFDLAVGQVEVDGEVCAVFGLLPAT